MEEKNIKLEPLFEEYVDFETFSKSDFRVVKVLEGLSELVTLNSLVGKKVVAILNLPPRSMMGIDSCGMLMSSVYEEDGEEKLNLMIVDDSIPAGAKLY